MYRLLILRQETPVWCLLFCLCINVKMVAMKIKEILEYGKNNLIGKEEAYRLAKMLLKYLLKVDDIYLTIYNEKEIEESIILKYKQGIRVLNAGMPIQYITHHQEFMGLDFYVDENVLIPQPDTEILVEEALKEIENTKKENYKILDLCAGSGAIGVSLAKYVVDSQVILSDISEEALKITKKNAVHNQVADKCKFVLSNLFENLQVKFDMIVSNPPYIQTKVIKTLSEEVQNEPIIALDGGVDGLDFYQKIAEEAYQYLNENGMLLLEIGYDQKEQVIKLLEETSRYTDITCKKDLSENDRVIKCRVR